MLITPQNAIEIVLAKKTTDVQLKLYETALQKWLFISAAGSLLIGAILAIILIFWKHPYLLIAVLSFLLVSMLLALTYQIAVTLPDFANFRNIERGISTPLLSEFNSDIDLINELAENCEAHHLNFAKTNYSRMAKQLRERISILVGALDKVGIIPLAVTAYLAYIKIKEEKLSAFDGMDWLLIALIFLYLFAVRMTSAAQWMEKVSEIFDHASTLKTKRERR
jgi:hypothetical protein